VYLSVLFFFFNDTATTEIYTLSLHDALPILYFFEKVALSHSSTGCVGLPQDRKSTRLNSSHPSISYAVFCLKKKNTVQSICAPLFLLVSCGVTFCVPLLTLC